MLKKSMAAVVMVMGRNSFLSTDRNSVGFTAFFFLLSSAALWSSTSSTNWKSPAFTICSSTGYVFHR